jgi:hypothetical protein
MKPYQRVASRYAKRLEIENPNRTEKIKYTIKGDTKRYFQVVIFHGRKKIGQVQGSLDAKKLIPIMGQKTSQVENLKCSNDVQKLLNKYPQIVQNDWKDRPYAPILSVSYSGIKEEYKGKKIGTDMYLAFARAYWDEVGKPFIFVPDGCMETGTTSDDAERVWASLSRKYPSSGLCLAILKRP